MPPKKGHPSPRQVAQSFVKQYYDMYMKQPKDLFRFYKEESHFLHSAGNQERKSITGIEEIKAAIASGYSSNVAGQVQVDLECGSVDAQPSKDGGVILIVTGAMTSKEDKHSRMFVQNFYLAPQETEQASYFVLNDAFRYLDISPSIMDAAMGGTTSSQTSKTATFGADGAGTKAWKGAANVYPSRDEPAVPVEKTAVTTPNADPTSLPVQESVSSPVVDAEVKEGLPVPPTSDSSAAKGKPSKRQGANSDASKSNSSAAAPATTQPSSQPAPSSAQASKQGKMKTWAQLVTTPTAQQAATPKPAKAPEAAPPSKGSSSEVQPGTNGFEAPSGGGRPASGGGGSTTAAPTGPNQQPDKPATAIYIKGPGVKPETSKEQIKSVFEEYGEIKTITLHAERGFAFIDYTSASSYTKAIQAGEVLIKGQPVHVEPRQSKFAGSAMRGGKGRGSRGGRGVRSGDYAGRGGVGGLGGGRNSGRGARRQQA